MIATSCAICGTYEEADELYPARFNVADLNTAVFSARRPPDRIHYRTVRCRHCGLVRSDPVADTWQLAELYERSTFDYSAEIDNLRRTYSRYLSRVPSRGAYFEIGCGNGFMLEEALALGFTDVRGVEPSRDAIAKAQPSIRDRIVRGVMRPGLLPAASTDVVAMFQVLDHLPDPGAVFAECRQVLRDRGWVLFLNHDVRAWSARLLGERSPVIDIEHTYLYDCSTLSALCCKHGFDPHESGRVWNRYSVEYVSRLLRLRIPLRWPISAPLGNLYLIAQKI